MIGEGIESGRIIDIAFWVIAISTIIAAIAVVQLKDLFRSALFLVVSFIGVAGMFVLLRAEFLAAVQILIYVGAISVLIIFAVLMTRDVEEGSPSNRLRIPVGIIVALFLAVAIFVVVDTDWTLLEPAMGVDSAEAAGGVVLSADSVAKVNEVFSNTVPMIARLLVNDFVLAFEVASVLLLAAVIGALALIREG
jgi:NADH-quinone oxidoreductase subunit J